MSSNFVSTFFRTGQNLRIRKRAGFPIIFAVMFFIFHHLFQLTAGTFIARRHIAAG